MVYTENTMTWCECDKCSFTVFAGFNADANTVKGMEKHGWLIGKKVLCPGCKEEMNMTKCEKGA